ncbi:NAD-dependent epimerase/dehydratase family protein [Microvirga terrestris]|uniref:NAD-dependent epimerase/dehydratase family protein n=1 Tax=Microvirga terrestris TaxID=2791024 RepID=A0ABS0HPG5_9HYPH|nr:NAD-dependent epimerase/dehydratase family protein [Microvirga terrestris]MBF9195358.1 NAD-dependent epimerase/dehydratase family protein [Microvirga terrestris]
MRILLTGSGGFLGRHILASPAVAGVQIICATRDQGEASGAKIPLGKGPWGRAEFEQALDRSQADAVIHCAGATHANNPGQFLEANTLPAAGLIAAMAGMARPPRAILIGSAAEYGYVGPDAMPVREDHPCHPRSDYGISKYTQTLLGVAAAERGLPIMSARLFNPVGLGMPSKLALPSFVRQIANAASSGGIINVGDLEARRDFIDVSEAARILLALAHMPQWSWPIVNICSGRAYRIGTLLNALIAASGRAVQVKIDADLLRPGDMPLLVGSIERLTALNLAPIPPDFDTLIPKILVEEHI